MSRKKQKWLDNNHTTVDLAQDNQMLNIDYVINYTSKFKGNMVSVTRFYTVLLIKLKIAET